MKNKKILILVEAALCVALATVLSFVKIYESPFGGSITLVSMLPIALFSYRRGVPAGLGAGLVYAILQMVLDLKNVGYAAGSAWALIAVVALDYILPFTVIGCAGMFRKLNPNNTRGLQMLTFGSGIFIVTLARYACHLLSGGIVWYSLTVNEWGVEEGSLIEKFIDHPWIYSAVYNGIFMVPEILITTIVGIVIASFLCLPNEKFAFGKRA